MSTYDDFYGGVAGGFIPKQQLLTANGTWTKPANFVEGTLGATMIGGGASGNSSSNELGGCGGQFTTRKPLDISGLSSVDYVIGEGGVGVNGSGTNTQGNPGGPTSFGNLLSVSGGVAPGAGVLHISPSNGGSRGWFRSTVAYTPDNSTPGIFGAPSTAYLYSVAAGGGGLLLDLSETSGGNVSTRNVGGFGYGAGGEGASNSITSGAGAPGAILLEWYEEL